MRPRPFILFSIIGLSMLTLAFGWVADVSLRRVADLDRQDGLLVKQVRSQEWELKRVASLKPELDEARFLIETYRANDRTLFRISRAVYKWGRVYGVSPYLIMSVAHRESNFNPNAVSPVGAVGVMQIMPDVWQLDKSRMFDIDYNVQMGTKILKHYLDQYGDPGRALFAYWGGNPNLHGFGYPSRVLGSKFFNHGG
jgi:soluble lytic murein transglycosylase-like protein